MPVIISPTGVQAVHPDGEVAVARAAPAGTAMGLSSFASKPIEEVVAANPRRSSRCTGWAPATASPQILERARARRREGPDPDPRLVVRAPARLGQPGDPGEARPQGDGAARARGRRRPRWLRDFARAGGPPDLSAPEHGAARRRAADVLRRLRRVDDDAAADLGRHRLAARAVGRPVPPQGRHPPRRRARAPSTSAPTRSRSPTTAATTSTARRRRSARCPASSTRSATRSRSCSTAASAAAATSSRRSRSAPAR